MRKNLLAIFSILGLVALTKILSAQEQPTFPLNELRRGMRGEGYTVLEGTTPQRIRVRVVGVINHPIFDGEKIVLVEMEGGMPIVAGMSGTPIYINGRRLGALGYQYGNFPLGRALGGVTPIGAMRNQRHALGERPVGASSFFGSPSMLQPSTIPISVSDATPENISWLERHFPNRSFNFFPTARFSEQGSDSSGSFRPGSSVTIFLTKGDVQIGATCTATEVTDSTFSLCGHPFLGEGEVEIPAYRTSIATTFFSQYYSFKLPQGILEPVGTVTYDNAFAVEGTREIRPNAMLPVNFNVSVDSTEYHYNFEVIRHRFYSTTLIEYGLRSLLRNIWTGSNNATVKMETRVFIEGRDEPVTFFRSGLVAMRQDRLGPWVVFADPWEILSDLQNTLSAIQQNQFGIKISRVAVDLQIVPANRFLETEGVATLDSLGRPTNEFRPGDEITVLLAIGRRGASERLATIFRIRIPKEVNFVQPPNANTRILPAYLLIMSGNNYRETEAARIPRGRSQTAEEFLSRLALSQRDPLRIFVRLVLPPEYANSDSRNEPIPSLVNGIWTPLPNVRFLTDRERTAESRVIGLDIDPPSRDAISNVDLDGRDGKLINIKIVIRN